MSLNSKRSRLGLLFDTGNLCAPALLEWVDGLFLNMLGSQCGGGLGGTTTVRV
jgi:hypothetical protein